MSSVSYQLVVPNAVADLSTWTETSRGVEGGNIDLGLLLASIAIIIAAIASVVAMFKPCWRAGGEANTSLLKFLSDTDLLQYSKLFAKHGFVRLSDVMSMEDQHMEKIGMAVGHIVRLRKAIVTKFEDEKKSWSNEATEVILQERQQLQENLAEVEKVANANESERQRLRQERLEIEEAHKNLQQQWIALEQEKKRLQEERSAFQLEANRLRYELLPRAQKDSNQKALLEAAKSGRLDVVEVLVKAGANVNAANNNDGWTPLHLAAKWGHVNVARFLIKAGANVNFGTNDIWTPLHLAAKWGHCDLAEALVKANANVNAGTNDVWTPLHLAAKWGHLDVVRYLTTQALANMKAVNKQGQTALDVAEKEKQSDIAKLLVVLGA